MEFAAVCVCVCAGGGEVLSTHSINSLQLALRNPQLTPHKHTHTHAVVECLHRGRGPDEPTVIKSCLKRRGMLVWQERTGGEGSILLPLCLHHRQRDTYTHSHYLCRIHTHTHTHTHTREVKETDYKSLSSMMYSMMQECHLDTHNFIANHLTSLVHFFPKETYPQWKSLLITSQH